MNRPIKTGFAGTLESNDCQVTVEVNSDDSVIIYLESVVKARFGKQIEMTIKETCEQFNLIGAIVSVNDKGAHWILRLRHAWKPR
jgi:citrate lyase subunit gamma (acyl carrier protein)